MPDNNIIRAGSEIEMHFRLSLDNGFVVDDTHQDETFLFTLGDGSILPSLEDALNGLTEGAIEKISLSPENAYGVVDPDNFMEMSRKDFPDEMNLEVGVVVGFSSPSGEEVPGTIIELEAEKVLVNFNHPLADQTVIFDVEILAVKNKPLN